MILLRLKRTAGSLHRAAQMSTELIKYVWFKHDILKYLSSKHVKVASFRESRGAAVTSKILLISCKSTGQECFDGMNVHTQTSKAGFRYSYERGSPLRGDEHKKTHSMKSV